MPGQLSFSDRDSFRKQCEQRPSLNSGFSYEDCTQGDIDDYTRKPDKELTYPRENRVVGLHELHIFLDPNLTPSPEVLRALQRLKNAMESSVWRPDSVIKGVHDLDTAFFNGALRGRVFVRWGKEAKTEMKIAEGEVLLGVTSHKYPDVDWPTNCIITLNAHSLFRVRDPNRQIWRTMVHELVHAYNDVIHGQPEPHRIDAAIGQKYSGGHGFEFRFALNLIFLRSDRYLGGFLDDENYRWSEYTVRGLPSSMANYPRPPRRPLIGAGILRAIVHHHTPTPTPDTPNSDDKEPDSKASGIAENVPAQSEDGNPSHRVQ